tara:strand:- start:191 stop:370 length:180 start_codon:yes stop_codon:yes gene_type:complete
MQQLMMVHVITRSQEAGLHLAQVLQIPVINSTIGITGSLDIENGDYLGAFHETEGELVC